MDIDKLVENYFMPKGDSLTKKTLWKLFDEASYEQKESKNKILALQEASKEKKLKQTEGEKFILSLPKFTPSEAWGDPNSEARQIMEGHLRQIGGGGDVAKRLQWLERLQSDVPVKGREITSPRRVISTLILLESLAACFNAFHESATGFVFEGFLAAILGGHQKASPESGSLPIEDIVAFSQWAGTADVPMSLKALKKTTNIKGSYTNLVDALNKFPEMKYVIAYKEKEGDDVSAIDIAEFTISRLNLLDILKVNGDGRSRLTFKDKSFEESYALLKSFEEEWEVLYAYLQRTSGYGRNLTTTLPGEETPEEVTPEEVTERNVIPEHQLPLAALSSFSLLTEASGGSSQWHISPTQLSDLKTDINWRMLAKLDFSPERLYKTADRYIEVLNDSIRSLFQATADLSTNINAYFATPKRGTALNKGNAAINNAQTIETRMTLQTTETASELESTEK